jgi:hypothetical protein
MLSIGRVSTCRCHEVVRLRPSVRALDRDGSEGDQTKRRREESRICVYP